MSSSSFRRAAFFISIFTGGKTNEKKTSLITGIIAAASIAFMLANSGKLAEIYESITPIPNDTSGASSELTVSNGDLADLEQGEVVRVIDGDTYILNIGGVETRVRLIGVDTPESVAPEDYRKENTEEGKEISELVKDKIRAGDVFYIEYDVSKTDKYNRTLAYLYFPDGKMVQEWLLEMGYANTATYPPNVKYADYFAELAHEAAENKIGLWEGYFNE